MDNEKIQGKKFSEFPSVIPGSADEVVGLHAGDNARFTVANFILAIRRGLANLYVPLTRTINNKALSADITLDASDVGAVPTTREVNGHALSSDIALDASDVGAVDADDVGVAWGVAGLDASGKVPTSQLPPIASTAADVTYDKTQSGLTADDVQEAIDALAAGAGGGGVDPETIAPVDETTTATVAHLLGSIFYLNDVLYRALSDIAVGDTINTGSGGNATQTTVAQNFKRTVTLTAAQYAQLSVAEKAADIVYIVTDEPPPTISTSTPQMDGTGTAGSTGEVSDAGHVHPSDTSKANQAQLAYVETSTTASRAYALGDYFCLNGYLRKATAAISQGATITDNNSTQIAGGGMSVLAESRLFKQIGAWNSGSKTITIPRGFGARFYLFGSPESAYNALLIAASDGGGTVQYTVITQGMGISFSTGRGTLTATLQSSGNTVEILEMPFVYDRYSTVS